MERASGSVGGDWREDCCSALQRAARQINALSAGELQLIELAVVSFRTASLDDAGSLPPILPGDA